MEFTEENTFNAGYSIHELYDMMQNYGYKWYRITNGELMERRKKTNSLSVCKFNCKKISVKECKNLKNFLF